MNKEISNSHFHIFTFPHFHIPKLAHFHIFKFVFYLSILKSNPCKNNRTSAYYPLLFYPPFVLAFMHRKINPIQFRLEFILPAFMILILRKRSIPPTYGCG